ncbi:MAG TPA: isoleucine--tRNA ligase [Patescibacteria group bacterium]|nr:isoleucine--tRNA ligase [Patescibacteria group bacterium]
MKKKNHKNLFRAVQTDVPFPLLEKEVLSFWEKGHVFEKSVALRPKEREFTFYDGPPFATGLPHYGHLLQGTIKDIIPRYWTMKGYRVERRFGWDCHGLPVEYELEKELHLTGRQDIEKMGIASFNEACRGIVLRYTKEWEKTVTRMGRWIDFRNDYKTMDPSYMESVWWVFKKLWDEGLIYEGYKSMHICPRCATPLSNFEVSLGYKDVTDLSVVVSFPLRDEKDTFVLAWTTTPWTLPGNVLLAVHPKFVYAKVRYNNHTYILAKEKVKEVFQGKAYKIEGTLHAKDLVGKKYEPLFFIDPGQGKKFEIVTASFVTLKEGTGVVHIAPAFGEEDLNLSQEVGAPFVQHVDREGKFTSLYPEWQGRFALSLHTEIIKALGLRNRVFSTFSVLHSYPHCWRCDTPLLNYAAKSWFVEVTKIKKDLLKQNKKIRWVPKYLRDGRFGNWLEGAKDWAISRDRYWGTPLPVWRCSCGQTVVIGSRKELETLTGKKVHDLHKHFVDELTFPCRSCGKPMKNIGKVLDCWFESGSMPYASFHYPFEHKIRFEKNFPADFIGEAVDQTRGWFYTLHVIAVSLFHTPAFKNVITTGLVLAEDGQKMSKSKKNYPDPLAVFEKYGADILRFYMVNSPVVKGEDLRFSEKALQELVRNLLLPYWNSYAFFVMHANTHGYTVSQKKQGNIHVLDEYILARLKQTTLNVTKMLNSYDLYEATKAFQPFVDDLSRWYVRRSRERFQKGSKDALSTLHTVLTQSAKLFAPFMPFFTENMYQNLTKEYSVHLASWPKIQKVTEKERKLISWMEKVRKVVELGHAVRKEHGVRVRQPLATLFVTGWTVGKVPAKERQELVGILKDELNVKDVSFQPGDSLSTSFDFTITDALQKEGEARELVRKVQDLRKKEGITPGTRIVVYAPSWPKEFELYVKEKTSADFLKVAHEIRIEKI